MNTEAVRIKDWLNGLGLLFWYSQPLYSFTRGNNTMRYEFFLQDFLLSNFPSRFAI